MKPLFNIDLKRIPSSNDKYAADREKNFELFLKGGFPNKKDENWKFSDLNFIISKNFKNITNNDNYKFDEKIETINDFDHNKIFLINGSLKSYDLQFEESKKQSEGEISEFEIKELVRSAVKKEINKEREITNSYIQANRNKISKLELEIKNLKNKRASINSSNSSFSSPRNHWELLTIGCIGYLAVLVISSF